MDGLAPGAPVQARVDALRRNSAAAQVVHTRISCEEPGYRLDYRLLATTREIEGTVFADDPLRLGRALARQLMRDLLPGRAEGADDFARHDPWAMQLLARATQAASEGAGMRALRMLRVVLDLEPGYAQARDALARVEALVVRDAAAAAAT